MNSMQAIQGSAPAMEMNADAKRASATRLSSSRLEMPTEDVEEYTPSQGLEKLESPAQTVERTPDPMESMKEYGMDSPAAKAASQAARGLDFLA